MAEFWLSYFRTLEKKWGITFLENPQVSKDGFLVKFRNLGCKVSILKTNPNHKKIVNSLRNFSLDLKILSYTRELNEDILKSFATTLEYEDVLLVDLNSRFFKASRIEKVSGEFKPVNLSRFALPGYSYTDSRIYLQKPSELLKLLNGLKYKTFLSKHVPSNLMSNIWSNFLMRPSFKTNSEFLQDFVRAYITVQILSLCSENPKIGKDFAVKPVKTLLWVTGDLVGIPEFKKLLVSILDGFEIKGSFDVAVDENFLLYTFGRAFSLGKKSDEVILSKRDFLPNFTKVFAPDIDMKPDSRKVVFHGTLFNRRGPSMEVFGMSSEIAEVPVKNPEHSYLDGKFIKNAYIQKYRKIFEFHCTDNDICWDRIVLDCRIKPVVYGPNAKTNDIKFNMWFGGESYF